MTIGIQCTHCHKRYNAPASMAGKRVKCKHCGKVFAIPPEAVKSFDDQDASSTGTDDDRVAIAAPQRSNDSSAESFAARSEGGSKSAIRAIGTSAGKLKSPPAEGEEPPAKIGDPRHGIATKLKRLENVSDIDLAEDQPARIISVRPSVPFDFPGADLLDRIVPPTLLILGIILLGSFVGTAHADKNVTWPGTLRAGLYFGLLFVIGFPVGYMAIRRAGTTHRFALPPHAAWRALGAFALPFCLAMVMWIYGATLDMLIVGTFLGALIACAAVWFLFRIQPQEISTAIGATVGGLAASVAISYGLLLLINLIMAASARSSGTNELTTSPVNPTFAWNVPIGTQSDKAKQQLARANDPITTAPAINETPADPTIPGTVTPPPHSTNPNTQPHFTTPPNPGTSAAGTPGELMPKPPAGSEQPPVSAPVTPPVPPGTEPVPPAPGTTPPAPSATAPAVTPVEPAPPTPAPEITSPFVASITPVEVGAFQTLLFPPAGGQAVAVVRPEGEVDHVELWGLNPPAKKGTLTLRREKGAAGRYIISPSGDLLAQIVSWPKLQISIWSFQSEKVVKSVPLNLELGTPELRGFALNDSIVIRWTTNDNNPDFEVFTTREPQPRRVTYFPADPYDPVSGNPSIIPDGRTLVIASEIDKLGGIDIFDLTSQRKRVQRLKMPLSKWVKPTGVAVAPDSKQIATFLENEGRGLITIHNLTLAGKLVHEHAYPNSPTPIGAAKELTAGGRTLHWLDPQTLLLYGTILIDAETGQTLADLGLQNVRTQSIVDKDTLLLQVKGASEDRLHLVKLNSEELTKARTAARAGIKRK